MCMRIFGVDMYVHIWVDGDVGVDVYVDVDI